MKVLELDENYADAWYYLGGGTVKGKKHSLKDAAGALNPHNS